MTELTSSSPWKKPRAVVITKTNAIKRKCKSFSLETASSTASTTLPSFGQDISFTGLAERNRTNIFSINQKADNNNKNDEDEMHLFFEGKFSNQNKPNENTNPSVLSDENLSKINDYLSTLSKTIVSNIAQSSSVTPQEKPVLCESCYIPIDWSLKTRLRFISKNQFKCYNNIKSIHESQAIYNFCKFNDYYDHLTLRKSTEDTYKTLFCEALNYWTFPYLPWLKLYPRAITLNLTNSVALPLDAQTTLLKDWTTSFKSLYNSLKCGQCPYFYMLTNTFSVLFRAETSSGFSEINAIMTPTTRGLRKILKDEGISFSVPLINKNSANYEISPEKNQQKETCDDNDTDMCKQMDDDKIADEDENDAWLEKIGANKKEFKVVKRNRTNLTNDANENVDNKPQSTIYIEGDDVQALFNFLLNSKFLIAATGPLTGVPPTLVSSKAFVGATVQKIKAQQSLIKDVTKTGETITFYTIDLNGPIMPYHIHRLCSLFKHTQSGTFEMTATTLDHSPAFNCTKFNLENVNEINEQAIDQSELESIKNNITITGTTNSIGSIVLENGIYRCN